MAKKIELRRYKADLRALSKVRYRKSRRNTEDKVLLVKRKKEQ